MRNNIALLLLVIVIVISVLASVVLNSSKLWPTKVPFIPANNDHWDNVIYLTSNSGGIVIISDDDPNAVKLDEVNVSTFEQPANEHFFKENKT